ncbi:hypothetical protein ACVWXM_008393 [Bradyrhizobium sp. GM7.3]
MQLSQPCWLYSSVRFIRFNTVSLCTHSCGHGWDVSARDGMCYPNGYLPPQEQAARQYYGGGRGYGHYPVPCGNGADIDTRDGQCYPTGTVPPQFQQGRQGYYGDDYYERRPRRRYY